MSGIIVIIIVFALVALAIVNVLKPKKPRKISLDFMKEIDITSISKRYERFTIPKKDGTYRNIEAPNTELKKVQREILRKLEKMLMLPSYVTAFRKGMGIKNHASPHVGKKIVINIDIKDFFNSITKDKLRKTIAIFSSSTPEQIESFVDSVTYNRHLPQGAPTSPFLANLAFLGVDSSIMKLLKKYDSKVSYTRYADDITFSSNNPEIKNAIRIITDGILPRAGYAAKKKKTTLYRKHTRQWVTGLVVNEKVSYPRDKYMKLRAGVYNYLKDGSGEYTELKGRLSFVKSISKPQHNKLKFYYRRKFKDTDRYLQLFPTKK